MADNHLKTPLSRSLNDWATRRITNAIAVTGKALPCAVTAVSGSIVTVSFEVDAAPFTLPNVTMPVLGPEFVRFPIQVGCLGVTFPADVFIGNVSGLGGGIPDLTPPASLSALVFMPVGNAGWFSTNPDALVLYATDACLVQITPTGVEVTGSDGGLSTTGPLVAGNGATGTFTSQDGKTITVSHGIITAIT